MTDLLEGPEEKVDVQLDSEQLGSSSSHLRGILEVVIGIAHLAQ